MKKISYTELINSAKPGSREIVDILQKLTESPEQMLNLCTDFEGTLSEVPLSSDHTLAELLSTKPGDLSEARSKARQALTEKTKYQQLFTFERIRHELVLAMMHHVLTKPKSPHNNALIEAIWSYGSNADRTLLKESGITLPRELLRKGMDKVWGLLSRESPAEKAKREKEIDDQIRMVKNFSTQVQEPLNSYSEALRLFEEHLPLLEDKKVMDAKQKELLMGFVESAGDVEMIDKLSASSLTTMALKLTIMRQILENLRANLHDSESLGGIYTHQKVVLLRDIQIIDNELRKNEMKLADAMIKKLSLVAHEDFLKMDSTKPDEKYQCSEIYLKLKRAIQVVKMEDRAKEQLDSISYLDIVRYLSYIGNRGNQEQKKATYQILADKIELSDEKIDAWLAVTLAQKEIKKTPDEITNLREFIKSNRHTFQEEEDFENEKITITQDEFDAILQLSGIYDIILNAKEKGIYSNREEFMSLYNFLFDLKQNIPRFNSLKKLLENVTDIIDTRDDFEKILTEYEKLNPESKSIMTKLLLLKDENESPAKRFIDKTNTMLSVMRFLQKIQTDSNQTGMLDECINKFNSINQKQFLMLAKLFLSDEYSATPINLLKQCLKESSSFDDFLKRVAITNAFANEMPIITLLSIPLEANDVITLLGGQANLDLSEALEQLSKQDNKQEMAYSGALLHSLYENGHINLMSSNFNELKSVVNSLNGLVGCVNKILTSNPPSEENFKQLDQHLHALEEEFNVQRPSKFMEHATAYLTSDYNLELLNIDTEDKQQLAVIKYLTLYLNNKESTYTQSEFLKFLEAINSEAENPEQSEDSPETVDNLLDLTNQALDETWQLLYHSENNNEATQKYEEQLNKTMRSISGLKVLSLNLKIASLNLAIGFLSFIENIFTYPKRQKLISTLSQQLIAVQTSVEAIKASKKRKRELEKGEGANKLEAEIPSKRIRLIPKDKRPAPPEQLPQDEPKEQRPEPPKESPPPISKEKKTSEHLQPPPQDKAASKTPEEMKTPKHLRPPPPAEPAPKLPKGKKPPRQFRPPPPRQKAPGIPNNKKHKPSK